jgi:hypothetical protein
VKGCMRNRKREERNKNMTEKKEKVEKIKD